MALSPGTRMFSGTEINAAIAAGIGQDAAAATFTGTTTVETLAATTTTTVGTSTAAAFVATGAVTAGSYVRESVATALTAVGSSRADALQLAKQINIITTATASTGVILPSVANAGVGAVVYVFNAGASAIQVYGSGSDTIDTVAATVGVVLTNAKRAMYIATVAATWVSAQLGVVSA